MNSVEILLFVITSIVLGFGFLKLGRVIIKVQKRRSIITRGISNAKVAKFESLFVCACGCGQICNPENGDLYDSKWKNWWKLNCYKRTIGEQT